MNSQNRTLRQRIAPAHAITAVNNAKNAGIQNEHYICIGLTFLPDDLTVIGDLTLRGHTSLPSSSNGLRVAGDLTLSAANA